jgi:hypothetical protein
MMILLIILVVVINNCNQREDFATKKEKMEAITQWFKTTLNPTYTQYKQDLVGTNIVEYEDALRLHQTGKEHQLINYI